LERLDRFECLERFDRLVPLRLDRLVPLRLDRLVPLRLDRLVPRITRRVMSTKKEENCEGSSGERRERGVSYLLERQDSMD